MQALEAEQNPRLTAKRMTATQKCDPKQTHASEGAMKFCVNLRGRDNLKFQAQSLRTRIAKTLLEPTCKRSMLKQPVRSAILWNRAIENSSKDHLYRKNSVMPSESLCPLLYSYKMHAKMNYGIKMGGGDCELRNSCEKI